MYFTTKDSSGVYFLPNLLSWIRIRMDPHSFHLLDPDPQKMNAGIIDSPGVYRFLLLASNYSKVRAIPQLS